MSTAHHPQTDGQTEVYNQTVEIALRAYCSSQRNLWVPTLSSIEFSLNILRQSSTAQTPFEMLYAYLPRSPLGFLVKDAPSRPI
jgi:hypothetical protein